uniref:Uncharacterized protein n=1 Tax=Meloidogyne incognita TaxID=6306 RepID=A0A914NHE4_MELIC
MQIDPRTTRTGAHLMAIRKAHAAIICYAAHIPSSFHTRTGAHLMAIRKAHAAIICYAAHIPSSFHVLTGFSEDFNTSQSAEEKGGKGKGKIAKNTARPA